MIHQDKTNYIHLHAVAGDSVTSACWKALDVAVEWDAYVLLTHNGRTICVTANDSIDSCESHFDNLARILGRDPFGEVRE